MGDPEFEDIPNQALAFEKLFDMAVAFESYVDHVQIFPSTIYRASATHLTFGPISGVRAQAASMDVALRPSLSKTPERAASHEPVQVVMRYCKFG